jgi:hypothetical protein
MQKLWRDGQTAHMGQTRNVPNISEKNFSESGQLEIQDGVVRVNGIMMDVTKTGCKSVRRGGLAQNYL